MEKLIASCCGKVTPLVKPVVKLGYEVRDGVGEIETGEGKLRQILINLLSNALKFTEAGSVEVQGRADDGRSVVISVTDTGFGIPLNDQERIFDEFQPVKGTDQKQKGTGLGLVITKKFVDLLGGTIGVRSEVGSGSAFTVRLPFDAGSR